MHCIIDSSHEHPLKNWKIFLPNDYNCVAYSQGKLIIKLSITQVVTKSPTFWKECTGIYVALFILLVDHFITLWS